MNNKSSDHRIRLFPLTVLLMILAMLTFMVMPSRAQVLDMGSYQRRTDRDPFMPPVGPKTAPEKTEKPVEIQQPIKPDTTTPKAPEIIEVDSGLSMTGVISTPAGNWAIILGPGGRSYLAGQGQQLGDWKVSSISDTEVVLRHGNMISRLPLKSQAKP